MAGATIWWAWQDLILRQRKGLWDRYRAECKANGVPRSRFSARLDLGWTPREASQP